MKNINICGLIYLLESSRRAYIGDYKWRKSAGKLDDTERLRILGWLRALNFALNFLRRGHPPNLAKFTRCPPTGLAPHSSQKSDPPPRQPDSITGHDQRTKRGAIQATVALQTGSLEIINLNKIVGMLA